VLSLSAKVLGERGSLTIFNYVMPQFFHRLTVKVDGRTRRERVPGEATYVYQLRAFAKAVGGGPNLTPAADAVRNMRVIDAVYTAAGLKPRG
jgi:predicted dehydrogenase